MWLAAAAMAGAMVAEAMAGPNGLQVLHSPSAEQTQQQVMVERLGGLDIVPIPASRPADPNSPAEKRAAAWRADHLTCASRKGRTRAQFEAECKPAATDAPS